MNIVILGAGELGRQLAWTLCENHRNKATVVDLSAERLERIRERLDVMIVHGDGASIPVLRQAGIDKASLLLAVTGSGPTNVLACKVARHFGVERTVCRVASDHFFSAEDGFPPAEMGIDHLINPLEDCVELIVRVARNPCVVERFSLAQSQAEICAFRVRRRSPLATTQLRDFPDEDLLVRIRFSLVIRNREILIPTGDFAFMPGDEVYAAGLAPDIERLVDFVEIKEKPRPVVIVTGATSISIMLVKRLVAEGKEVRVVEADPERARRMMDEVGEGVMFIQGDPTEADVLEDAGVAACETFIGALLDDEDNILGCLLAKNLGARKVIAVTSKAEYVDIVPAMGAIDCGFSPRLVAVNTVLNLLGGETVRVHAVLQRAHACVYELKIEARAPVCGKRIAEVLPASAIISLVFRDGASLAATGDTVLQEGDTAIVIAPPRDVVKIEPLLRRKRVFSL